MRPVAVLLTPVLPWPGGCGPALRAWDWLNELAGSHRVHVLVAAPGSERPRLPDDYPAEAVWPLDGAALNGSGRAWQRLGAALPPLASLTRRVVADWLRPAEGGGVWPELLGRLSGQPVERIVVFRLYLYDLALPLRRRFPDARFELDMDDLESSTRLGIAGALARTGRYHEAAWSLSSALHFWQLERLAPRDCRTVFLAAAEDLRRLPRRAAGGLACRPNRLPVAADFPLAPDTKELRLLFVGGLDYPPNEEAVRVLLDGTLPELRRRSGRSWRLRVVGRRARPELRALLERARGVELVDDAEELETSYAQAHVVLVPLRAGGGMKFKTLEAFAHRRPVVSTRHGVRGLGAVGGEHYLPAETAAEFAGAILRLAGERPLAERIAQAGWELCRRSFRAPTRQG